MSGATTIRVDRLCLPLSIGILPHEREAAQQVGISIDMRVEIPDRPSQAEENYVSYAPVVEHLIALSESGRHIDLVEELADEIYTFLFNDPRIVSARVEVMKPEIFDQARGVGVAMERSNPRAEQ